LCASVLGARITIVKWMELDAAAEFSRAVVAGHAAIYEKYRICEEMAGWATLHPVAPALT
jgi:hypothetical protein